jgi:hypothetical protein
VAVDEPRDRGEATTVEHLDLLPERAEVTHPADRLDRPVVHEDIRILDDVHLAERRSSEWRGRARGRRDLREVSDEEPAHRRRSSPDGLTW